jgi:Acetyl-CoA carboxylase, carboxyltransferase component (subunits alpha and beta)
MDKPFIEIGAFAGYKMYDEQGGCPAGGTVAGVGYVSGRQCVIVANDQTVKAGAGSRSPVKKISVCRRFAWKIICLLFILLTAPGFSSNAG